MQSLDDDQCNKCHIFYEHELLENRAASFKVKCSKCHFQKFRCYCPAQNCGAKTETLNPNEFVDGFRIKCTSGSCQNIFQVIKCPHPSCGKFSFFNNGNYEMGELINCKSCKIPFQQLTCPHCYESNYWRGDVDNFYAAGNITECYACKMKFQHLSCPHCKFYKYFPDCSYTSGVKEKCNNCHEDFQHALCVSCFKPNYYPRCDFRYGTPQTCQNTQCKKEFELVICSDCGKENLWKGSHHQQNGLVREYNCWNCHSKFSHQLCANCHESVYLNQPESFTNGVNSFKCPSCRNQLNNIFKCQTCKKAWTNSSSCKQCPPPLPRPLSGLFGNNSSNQPQPSSSMFGGGGGRLLSTGGSLFGGGSNSNTNSNSSLNSNFFGQSSNSSNMATNMNNTNSLPNWLQPSSGNNNQIPITYSSQNSNRGLLGLFGSQNHNNQTLMSKTQNNTKSPQIINAYPSKNDEKSKAPEIKNTQETDSSQDLKTCVVCMDNPADIAFIPCGHKKTCQKCSDVVMKTQKKQCPICRKNITNAIKIFD